MAIALTRIHSCSISITLRFCSPELIFQINLAEGSLMESILEVQIKGEPVWVEEQLEAENSSFHAYPQNEIKKENKYYGNITDGLSLEIKQEVDQEELHNQSQKAKTEDTAIWEDEISEGLSDSSRLCSDPVNHYDRDESLTADSDNQSCFKLKKDSIECERRTSSESQESVIKVSHAENRDLLHISHKADNSEVNIQNCTWPSNNDQNNMINEKKRPHKCRTCEKSFTLLSNLKTHIMIHEGIKPYQCNVCGKSFIRLSDLKKHNMIHEGTKPHKCEVCGKCFTQRGHLKQHYLIHEDKKLFMCEICGKSYVCLSYLKLHNMFHDNDRQHQCEICGKRYIRLADLRKHIVIHDEKRPHKCEICSKTFSYSSSLNAHILIHEGKRPHKCHTCGKSFIHSSDLKKHNWIHEGKRPYTCEVCGKGFTRPSRLRSHGLIHRVTMRNI